MINISKKLKSVKRKKIFPVMLDFITGKVYLCYMDVKFYSRI